MNNSALHHRLSGAWIFSRKIKDDRLHQSIKSSGKLTINHSAWQETGQSMILDSSGGVQSSFEFKQKYMLSFDNAFKVYFPDGRLFYEIPTLRRRNIIFHLCGKDSYRGLIYFPGRDCFFMRWQVSGPNKRYKMLTIYRRTENTPETRH